MAIGRELGAFDLTATSFMLTPDKGNTVRTQLNFEGQMLGEVDGHVLISMTISSEDGRDGTYQTCGRYFLGDDSIVDAITEGETTSVGGHRWRVAGVGTTSTGQSIAVQGEIDLKAKSYAGRLFERV